MEIGIGLPSTIPGVDGETITEWARQGEARGFSTLGTLDRVVYENYEPFIALAAAAAVTDRIRLTTAILIAPLRANHALFAKQAASIDRLSAGRLVLGLAPGGREDDYTASGLDFHRRGAQFDALIHTAQEAWRGGEPNVGPRTASADGPQLIIGGTSDAAWRRVAQHGAGWISGGGGPDMFAQGAVKAREAWDAAGREGEPRLLALAYFSLGEHAREAADDYLGHYYAFAGPYAERIAAGALVTPEAVRNAVDAFAGAGCGELILFPCNTDPEQVDLLSDAVRT
jgi:alkanesulfonate monooxygenase SsuD/methylene tetrahydromethanopterin reductase-like flavin-dependent oxidoreductase (luciferase family)